MDANKCLIGLILDGPYRKDETAGQGNRTGGDNRGKQVLAQASQNHT
jgi:hypothetical protein